MSDDQVTIEEAKDEVFQPETVSLPDGVQLEDLPKLYATIQSKDLWLCENGHAVGVKMPWKDIMRLVPLRLAQPVIEGHVLIPQMNLTGYVDRASEWPCSLCDTKKDWGMSPEVLREIYPKRKHRKKP